MAAYHTGIAAGKTVAAGIAAVVDIVVVGTGFGTVAAAAAADNIAVAGAAAGGSNFAGHKLC